MIIARKLTALVLILLMIVSISACGDVEETLDQETTGTTEVAEATVVEIESVSKSDNLVNDAYRTEISYETDVYENGEMIHKTVTAHYNIPKINLSGSEVADINNEIYDLYYGVIEKCVNEKEEFDRPRTCVDLYYEWTVYEDILSLLIVGNWHPDSTGGYGYQVYNIDANSGALVSNEAIYQAKGYTVDEYYEQLHKCVGSSYYNERYIPEAANQEYYVNAYNMYRDMTLEKDNLEETKLYFNKDNQLCGVIGFYNIAGSEKSDVLINLESFELIENYEEDIVLSVD